MAQDEQVIEAGQVKVAVGARPAGVRIGFDGVAMSLGSDLVVTTPPWAPHFYLGPDTAAVRDARVESLDGGRRVVIEHRGQNDAFSGTESLEAFDSGRVVHTFEGRLGPEMNEALVQFQMAALNPAVFIGRPFRAGLTDGTERAGTVPVLAESADVEGSTLAKGIKWIEFDSRLGRLRAEVDSDRPLTLYDHRKSRWTNERRPLFWFGDLGTRIRGGESVRYRVTYQFGQQLLNGEKRPERSVKAEVQRRATAQQHPWEERPLLIPRPKEAEFPEAGSAESGFDLHGEFVIVATPDASGTQNAAVEELLRFFDYAFGLEVGLAGEEEATTRGRVIRFVSAEQTESVLQPSEAYVLQVRPQEVVLSARDARGFMHAVQTLKQLATVSPSGRPMIRGATIRDWPSLPYRGVHLFTGSKGSGLHVKLIREVIAALKMNTLVLEAEYVRWDSHPEIHHPERGMAKSEVREIVALCRSLGIELIPLINTLGHCQWMFHGGVNLDLAEDPEAQWAYCVTNPKTYEFVFDIFAEALELFEPGTLHIGHDEFTHRGRFPYREESKRFTPEELLITDTLKLHGWLKERGVRTMLWGDMFLGQGEGTDALHAASAESAAKLRAQLPRDVLVADWHYASSPPDQFVSLDKFHAAGLETVAATWNRPENILNFARAAFDKKSRGLLQTTWAGYSLDPESFEREIDQYVAYVLAAEAAWNADRPPPERHRLAWRFFELMGMSSLRPERRAGWTVDLSVARNYSLRAEGPDGWFGLGPQYDLSAAPRGLVRLQGVEFDLGSSDTPGAIALAGKLAGDAALPRVVRVELDVAAEKLVVLHITPFVCPAGERLATYEIAYADGRTAAVDVVYGKNLLACDDLSAAADAPAVWWGTNRAGQTVALRAVVWSNPRPQQRIRALILRSADGSAPVVVLGVTGLGEPRGLSPRSQVFDG